MDEAPVVVREPTPAPWPFRRVEINGVLVGRAYSTADVIEFLRRAGLAPDDVDLEDPTLIEWRGGGSDVWT